MSPTELLHSCRFLPSFPHPPQGAEPTSVHVAIPLSGDLSAVLPPRRPRPAGPFTARLEIVFDLQPPASSSSAYGASYGASSSSAPSGARAQPPRVAVLPELEAELGSCSTSGGGAFLPAWREGTSCLVEYASAVEEALQVRVRDVLARRAAQPEPAQYGSSATPYGAAAGGWRDVVTGTPGPGGGALSHTVGTAVGALGSLASGARPSLRACDRCSCFVLCPLVHRFLGREKSKKDPSRAPSLSPPTAGAAAVATAMARSGVMGGAGAGASGVNTGPVPGAKEYERRAAFIEAVANALGRPLEASQILLPLRSAWLVAISRPPRQRRLCVWAAR